jgi:hypothetical protein
VCAAVRSRSNSGHLHSGCDRGKLGVDFSIGVDFSVDFGVDFGIYFGVPGCAGLDCSCSRYWVRLCN